MEFKKYFIVGTNDTALHDTMNGLVTGELIRCKDCKYHEVLKMRGYTLPLCNRLRTTMADAAEDDDYCSKAVKNG